ncbi:MAG: tellurite resistance protein [Yoonia sp.]|jgi:tellurite resistance protein
MIRFVIPLLLATFFSNPAQAFEAKTGQFDGLEFVADTTISGPGGSTLSLCHITRDVRILGIPINSNVVGYALATDACTKQADRPFNKLQMETAQSLGLVNQNLPSMPTNSLENTLRNAAIWVAISLGLVAVIIRRIKSLAGRDVRRALRKKASDRILLVMCYVAKCDGIVESHDITLISKTARRLTRRTVKPTEIISIADHINVNLSVRDFVLLGRGLRDSEKDIMMRAAFYIALANGRIMPAEHEFLKGLAHGIGIPGEDFRRVMNVTFSDLDLYPAT